MSVRIKVAALLLGFAVLSMFWGTLALGLAAHTYKTVKHPAQGDEPAVSEAVPAYKLLNFWSPVLLILLLIALLVVMLYVSSQKSGKWRGALIGTTAAAISGGLLLWLWPERIEPFLWGRSLVCTFMVGVLAASYYPCARLLHGWGVLK